MTIEKSHINIATIASDVCEFTARLIPTQTGPSTRQTLVPQASKLTATATGIFQNDSDQKDFFF